jgi:hypothetical protein
LRLAGCAAACAAAAAPATVAAVPLPTQPVGKGAEPTVGGAIVAGDRVSIRYALISVDGFGDLNLVLTPDPRSCDQLSRPPASRPYVWAWVHSSGASLPVGRPLTGSGEVRVALNFVAPKSARPVRRVRDVRLVFTRVDTSSGASWHGRLSAPAGSSRFGFSGTFAGRWCGQR